MEKTNRDFMSLREEVSSNAMQKLHFQMAGVDTRIQNIVSALEQNKNAIEKLTPNGAIVGVLNQENEARDTEKGESILRQLQNIDSKATSNYNTIIRIEDNQKALQVAV